jgi:hypothetical protein
VTEKFTHASGLMCSFFPTVADIQLKLGALALLQLGARCIDDINMFVKKCPVLLSDVTLLDRVKLKTAAATNAKCCRCATWYFSNSCCCAHPINVSVDYCYYRTLMLVNNFSGRWAKSPHTTMRHGLFFQSSSNMKMLPQHGKALIVAERLTTTNRNGVTLRTFVEIRQSYYTSMTIGLTLAVELDPFISRLITILTHGSHPQGSPYCAVVNPCIHSLQERSLPHWRRDHNHLGIIINPPSQVMKRSERQKEERIPLLLSVQNH